MVFTNARNIAEGFTETLTLHSKYVLRVYYYRNISVLLLASIGIIKNVKQMNIYLFTTCSINFFVRLKTRVRIRTKSGYTFDIVFKRLLICRCSTKKCKEIMNVQYAWWKIAFLWLFSKRFIAQINVFNLACRSWGHLFYDSIENL